MSEPRQDVLERNLERLFSRAHVPVRPDPVFVARLERELAPWLAPRARRSLRLVHAGWIGATLAAAALLAFVLLRPEKPHSGADLGAGELLARGFSIARVEGEASWSAVGADGSLGLEGPGAALLAGRALEVVAPPGTAGRLRVDGVAQLELEPGARLGLRLALAADAAVGEGAREHGGPLLALLLEQGGLAYRLDSGAKLALQGAELELLVEAGSGSLDLDGRAPWLAAGDPRAQAVHLVLSTGGARLRAGDEALVLGAPLGLWVHDGEPRDSLGRPLRAPRRSDPARVALEAIGAGRAPADDEEPPTPAEQPQSATLVGRITVDPELLPATGLRVVLLGEVSLPAVAWPSSREFTLEELGGGDDTLTFRWDGIDSGIYLVQVQGAGLAPAEARGAVLGPGAVVELEFALEPGARLRGHVVDAATGAPLAGALVLSETDAPAQILGLSTDELPDEVRARALTGSDGGFELAALSGGAQRLRASHPERAPSWLDLSALRAGEERAGVLFELTPGGALEGRVERDDGSPREGTQIIASHVSGDAGHARMTYGGALVDAEGAYRIDHLAPGSYVVLDIGEDEETTPADMRPRYAFIEVREGDVARVDFLAGGDGPALAGRLLGADGEPVERGSVHLVPRRADGRWAGEEGMLATSVERDGSFRIGGLQPGEHAVYAGTADDMALVEVLTLPAAGALERTFHLASASLEGSVREQASGLPLERAIVLVRDTSGGHAGALDLVAARAWTRADGRFRVNHLEPGTYELVVVAERADLALIVLHDVVVPGREPLDLMLAPGGSLELRVEDAAGEPLGDASIELRDPFGRPLPDLIGTRSDAAGRAQVRRLEPGIWTVVATHAGRSSSPARVEVAPGATRAARLVVPR